ncbi:MAG: class I SAM-dependent methyltransferase [Promethearchaeota archaeon]
MEIEVAKQILGVEFSFIYDDIIGPVFQMLNIDKNAKILDVGTGEGRMAISLALHKHSVLTGEPEEDFSEYAKQDWQGSAKRVKVDHLITFKPFDAKDLPFEDEEFDVVFMMGALHHINNRSSAIKECIRVVKSGGKFCIIEPTAKGLKIIRKRMPNHPDAVDPRDYLKEFPLEIKNSFMFDAFIFKKNEIL